jgi:hypothetical protein
MAKKSEFMKAVVAGIGVGAKAMVKEEPRADFAAAPEKHVCMTLPVR